ncbi:MAG: HAMP domain-containing histidine kinase [Clostridia bacterium]|nr:HAMP domain-containing histidine kinase [Clostridia bacterium]
MYYERQESHLKSVSAELLDLDYTLPSNWKYFEPTAKEQNINIYVFSFNINDIIQNKDGDYIMPSRYSLSMYTPFYSSENTSINSINWSNERLQEFLSSLKNMDEEKEFTFLEEGDKDSTTDTLVYGGELKGRPGANLKYYFCMVASISTSNYTTSLFQQMLLFVTIVIIIITIAMALIFARNLSNPINRLAATANHLATGDFNITFESNSCKEVDELAHSLNFAKEELSKTDQMRRDFIANVSHDLRTPLTMIQAYGEMIRDLSGNVPEKRNKHCQIIIDETKRLSLLVGDIQNLSKLQSGTAQFNESKFDIAELCKTVVHRFSIMSETQGYKFELHCSEQALCYGDYQKIEQVLYNLIGNALNYTGEDKLVSVSCKDEGNSYKIEISDTGKGISPDEIDAVWDRYYRTNQKKRNIVGSGLGLNIVKIILDGHKTKYGIDSTLNKGTTFWFTLNKFSS